MYYENVSLVSLIVPVDNSHVAGTMVRMFSMTIPFNNGFETAMWTRSVFYNTVSTVRFFQRIASSKMVSVPAFVLIFNVMCMRIVYSILILIVSLILKKYQLKKMFSQTSQSDRNKILTWPATAPIITATRRMTYKKNKHNN